MAWDSEFKLEQVHRPCVCGICHKLIGTKTPRMNLTVYNERRDNDYHKFYHITCLVEAFNRAIKELGNKVIVKHWFKIQEIKSLMKEI